MPDGAKVSIETISPEVSVAAAQNGLACLYRAWTQVAFGMMAAGTAELGVARTFYASEPADWRQMLHPASAQVAAQHWVRVMKGRYDAAMQAQREANDTFVAALFGASETFIEALPQTALPEPGEPLTVPVVTAAPGQVAPPPAKVKQAA